MSFSEVTAKTELVLARSGLLSGPEVEAETQLTRDIDGFTDDEIDGLPFGAIQLDADGTILKYNMYEAGMAGLDRGQVIGKNFFEDIAPCTAVQEFYGRFQRGVRMRVLHEKLRYHFAFKHKPVDVTHTLFYSEMTNSVWVFAQPIKSEGIS
jgi:photoactive yellow protein